MKLFLEKENKNLDIKFRGNVKNLLSFLNINSESVIVVKNNEIVTEDEKIDDNDNVKILSVISGG